jgi:uncharacterized DUF497 family protein
MSHRTAQYGKFEWDVKKEQSNIEKHKLSFAQAIDAFLDMHRLITVDELHDSHEPRYFCVGKIGSKIATVRFTMRGMKIRIIGAGFWRKGKVFYEKTNKER